MESLDNLEFIKKCRERAHKVFLDNWETKTQSAENGCVWTEEVHHRVLKELEDLSVTVEHLASCLERIFELNPDIKTITE